MNNINSNFSDQQHKIINTVIGHFIDAIPPGRDPKDFLRSSYRTRDSSEVYIALRLPIMRKLLDVNARKAFKDILDVHGGIFVKKYRISVNNLIFSLGQRQQTRFGSDSTSAQLIPRELCSLENLNRIEELMRQRMGKNPYLITSKIIFVFEFLEKF